LAPPLDFTLSSVTAEQGSVIITRLLASVVAPAVAPVAIAGGVVAVAGGVTLWAADKFLGGALSKAGEQLAQTVFFLLTGRSPAGAGEVRDPQAVADQQASEIALARGITSVIPIEGGKRVSIGENESGYRYVYQLAASTPGARSALLKVIVDMYGRHPVEYHVFEIYGEPAAIAQPVPAVVQARGDDGF
jgi:hypothetical protein